MEKKKSSHYKSDTKNYWLLINFFYNKNAVLHGPSGPYPSSEFEHSSIPATVKKIFNLKEFLTKRDAWAGTFEGVLSRSTPRTDCPGEPKFKDFLFSYISIDLFYAYKFVVLLNHRLRVLECFIV